MSVRNIRFYTTKGLVPPPIRRGRSGYYTADHVARLELVQELQSHGFTLSAIEKYVAGIPADASPEDIALHRTMLAPWQEELPIEMTRAELDDPGRARAHRGRPDHAGGARHRAARPARGRYRVAVSQLSVGLGLLDLGYPVEAAQAAAELYAAHGREIAEELYEVFRTMVWPVYKESGHAPGPAPGRSWSGSSRSRSPRLVAAYEAAMDERKREGIARRSR